MTNKDFQIIVCASGGGGNFQAIIEGQEKGGYRIHALIVDRVCGAIDRAKQHHIPCHFFDKKGMGNDKFWEAFSDAIPVSNINLIVLAGFIPIVPADICNKFSGKIINTHPSLLPKYGGKGMIGVKVQEEVIKNGDKEAGCTVHFVSPEIDGGKIILQKSIPVIPGEGAWELGGRVFKQENELLVSAINLIKENRLNGQMD